MKQDPRYNFAPRISDLPEDEKRKALLARDEAYRLAHLRAYQPEPRQPLLARVLRALRFSLPASPAPPAVTQSSAPVVEAGRGASKARP